MMTASYRLNSAQAPSLTSESAKSVDSLSFPLRLRLPRRQKAARSVPILSNRFHGLTLRLRASDLRRLVAVRP
jgi:hypothetical protein